MVANPVVAGLLVCMAAITWVGVAALPRRNRRNTFTTSSAWDGLLGVDSDGKPAMCDGSNSSSYFGVGTYIRMDAVAGASLTMNAMFDHPANDDYDSITFGLAAVPGSAATCRFLTIDRERGLVLGNPTEEVDACAVQVEAYDASNTATVLCKSCTQPARLCYALTAHG